METLTTLLMPGTRAKRNDDSESEEEREGGGLGAGSTPTGQDEDHTGDQIVSTLLLLTCQGTREEINP